MACTWASRGFGRRQPGLTQDDDTSCAAHTARRAERGRRSAEPSPVHTTSKHRAASQEKDNGREVGKRGENEEERAVRHAHARTHARGTLPHYKLPGLILQPVCSKNFTPFALSSFSFFIFETCYLEYEQAGLICVRASRTAAESRPWGPGSGEGAPWTCRDVQRESGRR